MRAQSFSAGPYAKWMVSSGYNGAADRADAEMHAKLYAQEMAVDSFRHTDWTVTLPLMFLDLHKLAEDVTLRQPPLVTREVGAFFQTWIILFGSVGRFFVNEMRVGNDGKRTAPRWKLAGWMPSSAPRAAKNYAACWTIRSSRTTPSMRKRRWPGSTA